MSTIHIHQMSKADVMMEISLHHRGLLSEVVEYLKATQPLKAGSAATYEDIAKEILYAECVKQFRYSDYITSASDAMSRVNRTYGDWVREENKKRQAQAEREAREFERFKQKCAKKGLDLTRENAKRIKRKALVPMLKILIPCLCFLALALITGILTLFEICGYEVPLAFTFFAVTYPLAILFKKLYKKFLGL